MNEQKNKASDYQQKPTSASQQKNSTNAARQISTNECQQTSTNDRQNLTNEHQQNSTNAARQKAATNDRQKSTNEHQQNSTIASRQNLTRSSTESHRRLRLILSILLVLAAFWLGRQDFLKTIFPPASETQETKVVEPGAKDVVEQGSKEGVEQRHDSSDKPLVQKPVGQDASAQEAAIQKSADQEPAVQKTSFQKQAKEESAAQEPEDPRSPEFVASALRKTGKLPDRFLSKKEARKLGWVPEQGNLNEIAPGKSIGGDRFGNYEGKLPAQKGRSYREADVHDSPERRGAERLVFSNDGLIFYTPDHYKTFYDVSESFPGKKLP